MDRLAEFVLTEVLQSDAATKHTVLLGQIEGKPCIIKLSRLALPEFQPGKLPISTLSQLDANDVYSWGTGTLNEKSTIYLDVVYPASETHIAKYKLAPRHMIRETPEMYKAAVQPYIAEQRGDRISWVRAILFEGAEADRVLFRDEHFVLLPNSKWDRKTVSSLYLLALFQSDQLHSVRDLTSEHIPLLEHVRDTCINVANERWGVPKSQIKTYFHYQPSYYQLHIHVANVALEQNDFCKSLLVDNVIDILRQQPMRKVTLTYALSEAHALFPALSPALPR